MTYKIKYLPLAVQDLNDIARYLSGFYPKTASRVLKELREKITKLGDTPKMCEVYHLDPAYRRMVVDQYLVFYRVNDEIKTVEIHRVLRGAWNLPQYLEGTFRVRLLWTMLHLMKKSLQRKLAALFCSAPDLRWSDVDGTGLEQGHHVFSSPWQAPFS